MNNNNKGLLLIIFLCMLMISLIPSTSSANSAEPPALIILVNNPPDDFSLVMTANEKEISAIVRRTAWEGYYSFYSRDLNSSKGYKFKVTADGKSFDITLTEPLQRYNNMFTLNLSSREFKQGTYPFRSAILVSIRVLLTLLLEGFIFWLFKYREKRSWTIFLAINLVTQGALNVWLDSGSSLIGGYLILLLIFGEFFVFLTEMVAFPLFIRENKKSRAFIYAFVANLVSLIAGGYIISVLPV